MRRTFALSLAAAAALCAGGIASAQPQPNNPAGMTRSTVEQRSTQAFERMDANHDGVLNAADPEARMAERQKAMFDRIDADHDGQISLTEFSAQRDQRRERVAGRREQRREHFADRRRPGGEGGPRFGMRGPGRRGPMEQGGPGMLRAADTDSDGTITEAEFTQAALTRFDRADTNKDGTVSPTERRGARGPFRGPPPPPPAN